jgi:hypothetical protein
MRRAGLLILSLVLATVLGCRPVPPRGMPRDPGEALTGLAALPLPDSFSLNGRLRAAIAGIELDMGLAVVAQGGNARLDVDLPFGGRALTLIIDAGGGVLCAIGANSRSYFSPDADQLAREIVGGWARASLVLDIFSGRLPAGVEGDARWERGEGRSLLGLGLPDGRRARLETLSAPPRLRALELRGADGLVIATARWDGWTREGDYWFPAEIEFEAPGRMDAIRVEIREFVVDPDVDPEMFDLSTPPLDAQPIEALFGK